MNYLVNGLNPSDVLQNQITFQPSINTVAEFKIDNSTYSVRTAHLYQITAASAQTQTTAGQPVAPVSAGTMAVSGSSMTITLPALSVTTIDVH